jgi:hypothetical protein
METTEFRSNVTNIDIRRIRPSEENPRGPVRRDASFERLADSISKVRLLVPIVVREVPEDSEGHTYELIDGERRYWASLEVGLLAVPAHVVSGKVDIAEARMWMFHLHMTREQWGPLAQCHSLDEAFPELADGIAFDDKPKWIARLKGEAAMSTTTARDRVHVLSWSGALKDRIYSFNDRKPNLDVYSYVLALEVSIVEPSRQYFKDFYNHGAPPEVKANSVRSALLDKTEQSLETGTLRSREEIRFVKSLFDPRLGPDDRGRSLHIFETLVADPTFHFTDVHIEIEAALPALTSEPVPRTGPLTGQVLALTRRLVAYEENYGDEVSDAEWTRRESLHEALSELVEAIEAVRASISA